MVRAPKDGVATQRRPRRPRARRPRHPRHRTLRAVTIPPARPRRGRPPQSPTPSSSRSPSPRSSSAAPTIAGSSPSPAGASATCSPTCPSSPATTSGCGRPPRRSRGRSAASSTPRPFWDGLRLLDSTPVPCGPRAKPPAARSSPARRIRLVPLPLALLLGFSPLPPLHPRWDADRLRARLGQRTRAPRGGRDPRARLDRGLQVVADKGFAGVDFEPLIAALGAAPAARPQRRAASLWLARRGAPVDRVGLPDLKGQLSLERTGGAPARGRRPRRPSVLALAAGLAHNQQIGEPGRHFRAYAH